MTEITEEEDPEFFPADSLSASPIVRDLAASIAWYYGVLGFGLTKRFERDGQLLANSASRWSTH